MRGYSSSLRASAGFLLTLRLHMVTAGKDDPLSSIELTVIVEAVGLRKKLSKLSKTITVQASIAAISTTAHIIRLMRDLSRNT